MTTVYLDKRAEEEQAKEEVEELEKAKAKAEVMKAVASLVTMVVDPLIFMLLWNWLVPGLFGLATIGYLKAFGLYLMSRILFHRK
ncbi:hypothetical protein [Synechococcus phage S-B64]|uniref:Uncharacterized protein n=2 Tax=Shandvirus TaxID=2948904 RepID=A0A1Z1LWC2_9CAUD|nr:hypothetical protein KNT63_gp082 [Synechococcus phage S-H35]YP_010095354.1 hypothetical protein KNT88_gp116 [Synechococcus phage S-B64]ARW56963.1 hypothetical protein [Synechococcus phage S-H35]AWD90152.1 hypothetical protein [Synechococcus phage S-B64]